MDDLLGKQTELAELPIDGILLHEDIRNGADGHLAGIAIFHQRGKERFGEPFLRGLSVINDDVFIRKQR